MKMLKSFSQMRVAWKKHTLQEKPKGIALTKKTRVF